MKIALSTDAADLDGDLNPAFGRCRRFLIFDTATGHTESVANPGYGSAGGAGIQAARTLAARGIERIISGKIGPNARPLLEQAGVAIVENRSGPLRTVIADITANPYPPSAAAADRRSAAGHCACTGCDYRTDDDGGLACFKQRCPRCGASLERRFD